MRGCRVMFHPPSCRRCNDRGSSSAARAPRAMQMALITPPIAVKSCRCWRLLHCRHFLALTAVSAPYAPLLPCGGAGAPAPVFERSLPVMPVRPCCDSRGARQRGAKTALRHAFTDALMAAQPRDAFYTLLSRYATRAAHTPPRVIPPESRDVSDCCFRCHACRRRATMLIRARAT